MESLNKLYLRAALHGLPPQTKQVAEHLLAVGSISGVEAAALFKCRHLPRRIADIREAGATIRSDTKRDSTGQRYVRYVLQ